MSKDLAELVRGQRVCAVGNVFELAPWADALVANDRGWWKRHPQAAQFAGRRFSANRNIDGVQRVDPNTFGTSSNSGVLALDVARNLGATQIVMLGFDMHGTHFFGPYTNGCTNTQPKRRDVFQVQFRKWAERNKGLRVVNCTAGTHLKAFQLGNLKDYLNAGCATDGRGAAGPQVQCAVEEGRGQGSPSCAA